MAQEPELTVASSREATAALNALYLLKPQEQNVIRLAVWHGLAHVEIASVTRLPLGTVKSHLRRGLLAMRRSLEDDTAAAAKLNRSKCGLNSKIASTAAFTRQRAAAVVS